MCKTELEEILITNDASFTWTDFDESEYEQDKEDETVYYTDGNAKRKGMELRSLQCMIYNCESRQNFPNVDSLRRHMEQSH